MNRRIIYRAWRYFRIGYSTYLSFPVSIFNFLTITFYLMIERIPILKTLLPHFMIFAFLGLICLVPIGILFGYLHMRRTMIFGTEAILSATSDPLRAYTQRVTLENTYRIYKALGIEPDENWKALLDFWRKADKKWGWRP